LIQAQTVTPTRAPTAAPTVSANFVIPRLPISKAGALYPDCRAEIIFVLDVSGSVALKDQQTMMRFVVQFMIAVEANIKEAKFGVVIFGIAGGTGQTKWYNDTDAGGSVKYVNGPFGNGLTTSTELMLRLSPLKYNCAECTPVNASWSQLEMLYYITYAGSLTPTWDGMNSSKNEYDFRGDPAVPGRFIVLITDGIPNDGGCGPTALVASPECNCSVTLANWFVGLAKNGTLLLTVGMNLRNDTQGLLISWASEPKNILSIPNTDYGQLAALIPKLLAVLCPAGAGIDCLAEDATSVSIAGAGFLNTGALLQCRYFRENEAPTADHTTQAQYVNSSLIICPLPTENWFPGEWTLEYTQDGRGYYKGAKFKYGTLCRPELLVIWWPFCALALLPLAFCRAKKVAPVTTQKVSRGVARPAPAATEEYEEYEEVEEIVAPPEPVNKWKVAPTAYIGFGRARMSVDWAGVAPESAPHEGVRKKVVKKVVSDHAPVPTAGPAFVPVAAPQEETQTETVTHKPQTVEELDWVNSFMDRIAAVFCCCCVKKK
jgi:hypothetical protein